MFGFCAGTFSSHKTLMVKVTVTELRFKLVIVRRSTSYSSGKDEGQNIMWRWGRHSDSRSSHTSEVNVDLDQRHFKISSVAGGEV